MGFWGTLTSAIPVVGPFIGAGLTAFSAVKALKGRGSGSGQNGENVSTDDLIRKQGEVADTSLGFAKQLFPQAQEDLGAARGYLHPLARGSTQQITETLAPDISAVNQGFDAAQQQAGRFMPRTGGGAMAQVLGRNQKAAEIAKMISRRRAEANKQLASLGMGQAGLALEGARVAGGSLSANLDVLQQRRSQTLGLIGKGAEVGGALLARWLFGSD